MSESESPRESESVPDGLEGSSLDETVAGETAPRSGIMNSESNPDAASDEKDGNNTVIQDRSKEPIRYGSPFAVDPVLDPTRVTAPAEVFIDAGPLKYTAMGAVAASAMVILFASAAAYWFPGGGTLIAVLGCVLAILGLFSYYRFRAFACLVAHLALFLVSYARAIS